MLQSFIYATMAVFGFGHALARPGPMDAPVQVLETRRSAPQLGHEALRGLQQDLFSAVTHSSRSEPDLYKTNGSLDLSFSNAELFSL